MAMFHTNVLDNQIKALPTVKAISNQAIASFDTDIADRLVNLQVAITATGGGGTPSTPIAINGFSACDLVACGINLLDKTLSTANKRTNNGVIINSTGNSISGYIPVLPETTYYILNALPSATGEAIAFYDKNKNYLSRGYLTNGNGTRATPINAYYMIVSYPIANQDTVACNYPSTDTSYHAYNGTTHTINFGQTVYGGSLDVISGKLTITEQAYTYVGDVGESWGKNGNYYYTPINALYKTSFTVIADRYKGVAPTPCANLNNFECALSDVLNHLNIRDDSGYATADDFRTWLSNNNLTVVYKYVTPIEIQLSSEEVASKIVGNNNIYADTGDIIDLKYQVTVGQAIV